jgi:hypothetical protein
MKNRNIEKYLDFVRPYYAPEGVAGDFTHIQRIADRLEALSCGVAPEPLRPLLWFLAAFHGLSEKMQNEEMLRVRTAEFLKSLNWTDGQVERAFRSLARHAETPMTVEEMIVHDADRCELLATAEPNPTNAEALYQTDFRTPVGRRWAKQYRGQFENNYWRGTDEFQFASDAGKER